MVIYELDFYLDIKMCNVYWIENKNSIFAPNGEYISFNIDFQNEIYPNRLAPIITKNDANYMVSGSIWGLPPPPNINRPITNVRNLASPFWQSILNNMENRCLVPANAFCEWAGEKGKKQKVWFGLKNEEQFFFAGVWKTYGNKSNFAFLTTEPNDLVAPIHEKSMPVILKANECASWLSGNFKEITNLAKPYSSNEMQIRNSINP